MDNKPKFKVKVYCDNTGRMIGYQIFKLYYLEGDFRLHRKLHSQKFLKGYSNWRYK